MLITLTAQCYNCDSYFAR